MNTIKETFQKNKAQGNGLLIGYITAGDNTRTDAKNC
jgi:tryptophan synthase alpha subunit